MRIRAKIAYVELIEPETYVGFVFNRPKPVGTGWLIDESQPDPSRCCVGTELCFPENRHHFYRSKIGKPGELTLRFDGLNSFKLLMRKAGLKSPKIAKSKLRITPTSMKRGRAKNHQFQTKEDRT